MLKKIFIPGWMNTAENCVDYAGLEIWKKKTNIEDKIDSEYVIGYSLGADFVLINWEKNRNTKLIVVNPLLPRRSLFSWFWRWIKFLLAEGSRMNKKRFSTLLHPVNALRLCYFLLTQDISKILDEIPKESIIIIRGKEDSMFCDEEAAKLIRSKNIRLVEVEGAGHNWDEKFNDEIKKIIK